MQAAKATPGILKMCGSQKLLDQLTECNKLLESVQKVHADASTGTIAAHIFCWTWHNLAVSTMAAHVFWQATFTAHISSPTLSDVSILVMHFIKLNNQFRVTHLVQDRMR